MGLSQATNWIGGPSIKEKAAGEAVAEEAQGWPSSTLSGTPMPTATPWPVSTPVDYAPMIGARVEGEQGNVEIWNLQKDDGSKYYVYKLNKDAEERFLDLFWQVNLEGPATKGLEVYYRIPVKYGEQSPVSIRKANCSTGTLRSGLSR